MLEQPYRLFFPMGLGYAFLGTVVWPLHFLGWLAYPGASHANVMIGGFLVCFVTGFLMTAVPRFTGTFPAKKWEIALAVVFALVPLLLSWIGLAAQFLVLFVFFARRFAARKQPVPLEFLFVPVGILCGVLGALGMHFYSQGRMLVYEISVLCFVLGVGSRIVRMLLGWASTPQEASRDGSRATWAVFFILGCVGAEIMGAHAVARVLSALAASWIGWTRWHLPHKPQSRGYLAWALWSAAWAIILGQWAVVLFPDQEIHMRHIVFVAGFGLMTLMVSTRVTLAHGGFGVALEAKSKALVGAAVLVWIAALTRISAHWMPASYLNHLAYASMMWMVAVGVWSFVFLPKIIGKNG